MNKEEWKRRVDEAVGADDLGVMRELMIALHGLRESCTFAEFTRFGGHALQMRLHKAYGRWLGGPDIDQLGVLHGEYRSLTLEGEDQRMTLVVDLRSIADTAARAVSRNDSGRMKAMNGLITGRKWKT